MTAQLVALLFTIHGLMQWPKALSACLDWSQLGEVVGTLPWRSLLLDAFSQGIFYSAVLLADQLYLAVGMLPWTATLTYKTLTMTRARAAIARRTIKC